MVGLGGEEPRSMGFAPTKDEGWGGEAEERKVECREGDFKGIPRESEEEEEADEFRTNGDDVAGS